MPIRLPNRTTPTYDAVVARGGITGAPTLTMPTRYRNWQPIAATSGTDKTPADGTQWVTSIFIPGNITATGIGYLVGSVGGTDRTYAVLYDADGAVVANSTLASNGTVAGTAAQVQELAFTAPVEVKGPAMYFVGISMKGTTARLRTVPAHTHGGLLAGDVAQTHATVAAITPPATFTADEGPVVYVY